MKEDRRYGRYSTWKTARRLGRKMTWKEEKTDLMDRSPGKREDREDRRQGRSKIKTN